MEISGQVFHTLAVICSKEATKFKSLDAYRESILHLQER